MGNDLTILRRDGAALEHALREAEVILRSRLAPSTYRTPEAVLVAVELGRAYGFAPLQALRAFHVIEDLPTLSAQAMAAVAIKAGCAIAYPERTRERVRCVVARDGREHEATWTLEEAIADGVALGKDGKRKRNWTRSPRQMLTARATAEALRLACPDVLLGIYVTEEIEDEREVEEVTATIVDAAWSDAHAETIREAAEDEAPAQEERDATPEPDDETPPEIPRGLPWREGKFPTVVQVVDGVAKVAHEPRLDKDGVPVFWARATDGGSVPLLYRPDGTFVVRVGNAQPDVRAYRRLCERFGWLDLARTVELEVDDEATTLDRYAAAVRWAFREATIDEVQAIGAHAARAIGLDPAKLDDEGVRKLSGWLAQACGRRSLRYVGKEERLATYDVLADVRRAARAEEDRRRQELEEQLLSGHPDVDDGPF